MTEAQISARSGWIRTQNSSPLHQPTLIQNYNMGFDSGGGAAPPLPLIAQLSKLFSGGCQRALPAALGQLPVLYGY